MKRIKYILSTILVSALLLNFLFVSSAKAADYNSYLKSVLLTSLPADQSQPSGILNINSTTFRLDLTLSDSYDPSNLALMLDSCPTPIDQIDKTGFTGKDYTLMSRENTLHDLKVLLGSCGSAIEGNHSLYVKATDGLADPIIYQETIIADFTAPVGAFSATNPDGKSLLKVGDKVDIAYASTDTDISQITGKIYGRDLTWQKIAGKFISQYIVQEGDTDQIATLPLNNVIVYDNALNLAEYGNINLPTTFSIDANSPRLALTSPQNGKTYSSKDLSIGYTASEYDSIEFYLDGALLSSGDLIGLAEGTHTLKIIARDLAGNETIVQSSFRVDSVAPAGSIDGFSGEITQGSPLEFSGTTEPGVSVQAEVGTNIYNTVSDSNGKFNFSIDNLKAGSYEIYLTLTDSFGNKNRFLAGNFIVNAKPKEPVVKLAKANTVVSDQPPSVKVVQKIALPRISEDEPFKIGRIDSSGTTSERVPANYQSWWILSAIIMFSIFLSAITYNIYSRIVTVKALGSESSEANGEFIKEGSIAAAIKEEMKSTTDAQVNKQDPPDDETKLRW